MSCLGSITGGCVRAKELIWSGLANLGRWSRFLTSWRCERVHRRCVYQVYAHVLAWSVMIAIVCLSGSEKKVASSVMLCLVLFELFSSWCHGDSVAAKQQQQQQKKIHSITSTESLHGTFSLLKLGCRSSIQGHFGQICSKHFHWDFCMNMVPDMP